MSFRIRGMAAGGTIATVDVDAHDEADARVQARARGIAPLSVQRVADARWRLRGRQRFPLLLFSQEFLALLQSGVSLLEALQTLAEKEQRAAVRTTLAALITHLRAGQALSGAMEQERNLFPPMYVALVRASERTGDLPEALGRYIAYRSQLDDLKKKLIGAAIYPVVLIAVGLLVTLFLLGYVVPRFSEVYAGMGNDLPFLSRLLMHWGGFVAAHGFGLLVGGIAAIVLLARVLTRPQTLRALTERFWRLPGLGARARVFQLARFYRTLGMLQRGGIAIVPALAMVTGLLPVALRPALARATATVREGRALSEAFDEAGLATAVALRLVRVGERSGRLGEMLERSAAFHDEEMSRWVDWCTRLVEPLLMTVIGALIGGIVLLLYLPIFELAGNIQ